MKATAEELIAAGYVASRARRLDEARAAFTAAVSTAEEANDLLLQARAWTGVGKIERDLGETEAALEHYRRAVEMLRGFNERADSLRLAHTVRHVGDILFDLGKLEDAVPCYEEALAIYKAHPEAHVLDVANAVAGFARLHDAQRDADGARELWSEAMKLYRQADVQAGVDEAKRRLRKLGDASMDWADS